MAARDESGGAIEAIDDEGILSAYRLLARTEGVFAEPASAISLAGALQMGASGCLRPGDVLVLTLTGHGLKDPDTAIANSDAARLDTRRALAALGRPGARLMKVIVIQADGVADEPVDSLNNRTPLEVARAPHLDHMASRGILGLTRAIPRGMAPEQRRRHDGASSATIRSAITRGARRSKPSPATSRSRPPT